MALTLTIVNGTDCAPAPEASFILAEEGGEKEVTIGRRADCDWILPDANNEVSRLHAIVYGRGSAYYLDDKSSNGVYLMHAGVQVGRLAPYRLADGDVLTIGAYQIRVSIGTAAPQRAQPGAGAGNAPSKPEITTVDSLLRPPTPNSPMIVSGSILDYTPDRGAAITQDSILGESPHRVAAVTRDSFFSIAQAPLGTPEGAASHITVPDEDFSAPPVWDPEAQDAAGVRLSNKSPVESPHAERSSPPPTGSHTGTPRPAQHRLPQVPGEANPGELPRDPRERISSVVNSGRPAAARDEECRSAQPNHRVADGDTLRGLLSGAGIPADDLPEDLAQDLGRLLRIAIAGVMDLLRARAEVKRQFRMDMTIHQANENNPLKFSATPEHALENMFVKRDRGYLGPVEALEAGYADLRVHQLALLAGMRHAFLEMLRFFDPTRLEQQFREARPVRNIIDQLGGPKPWEQYKVLFDGIRRDMDGHFRRLFGEAFVDEYERQVRECELAAKRR